MIPEQYYITIKSSDNVDYMDRNISAMGYIVTQSEEGTLNYYFTSNIDESKEILGGVVQKSVTSLLQAVGKQYVEAYEGTDDGWKKKFEKLLTNCVDENGEEYDIQGYITAVNAEITNEYQKALLKYVHLNVSNME